MLKLDFEQAKIKEQERIKRRKEKKIRILKLLAFLLVLAVLISIIVFAIVKLVNKPNTIVDNVQANLINVNGKLANYIKELGNTYNIRYLGEFGAENWNKDIKTATIEFTCEGSSTAIYSKELNRHVITQGENVYSIIDVYRIAVEAKKPVDFGAAPYNLLSDFGQRYVADVEVKENGVDYIYQEYVYENAKIRYYFVDNDLRHIKIITGDSERKINVIVDRKTVKKELLKIPDGYNKVKA